METRVGFIGLGIMGRPMATNLRRAGVPSPCGTGRRGGGAAGRHWRRVAVTSPAAVFAECDVVLLMLADEAAVDEVLRRGTPELDAMVSRAHRRALGTTSPDVLGRRRARRRGRRRTLCRGACVRLPRARGAWRARGSRRRPRRGGRAGRTAPAADVPCGRALWTRARRPRHQARGEPLPLHHGRRARGGLPPRDRPGPRPRRLPAGPGRGSDGERRLDPEAGQARRAGLRRAGRGPRRPHQHPAHRRGGPVGRGGEPVARRDPRALPRDGGLRGRGPRHGCRRDRPGAAGRRPARGRERLVGSPAHGIRHRVASAASAVADAGRAPPRRAAARLRRRGSPAARRGCRAGPRPRGRRRPSRRPARPPSAA